MNVPDPATLASMLPDTVQTALIRAFEDRGGWRVENDAEHLARRYSLVAVQGPYLSAFGLKVRAALVPSLKPAGSI
mgnify:CR=1 FL=1